MIKRGFHINFIVYIVLQAGAGAHMHANSRYLTLNSLTDQAKCETEQRLVPMRAVRVGPRGEIIPGQSIVRARIVLDNNTLATVIEHPKDGVDQDSYNSVITIERGDKQTSYSMSNLIKDGYGLRLVEVASLCESPDNGTLVLAFEAGSTGAVEGFAIVRHSQGDFYLHAFPLVNQGRLEISHLNPNSIRLWSAIRSASQIDCDACKKEYSIQECTILHDNMKCSPSTKSTKPFLPDNFMKARIRVY